MIKENNKKVPCGGFYLGDGLTMDGNTLKSLGGEQVQTDYAQNDPTAKDYIKNRPFYKETKLVDPYDGKIYPLTITTEYNGNFNVAENNGLYVEEGHKNVVIFDNQTYECEPFEGGGTLYIGAPVDPTTHTVDFSTYPFLIFFKNIFTKDPGEHTVSIYYYKDVCHYENGYLPKLIVNCPKDENGKPYIAADDIAKIKYAYDNGIGVKLDTWRGNIRILAEVNEVSSSGLIRTSYITSNNLGVTIISHTYSTTDGSLIYSGEGFIGQTVDNGHIYPVLYINNKYCKITINSDGTLSATQITK